jgi:serine/threonine-protein kinase
MIGKTISHYRILEKLGEGGMGVVYKAEDMKLGRTVALKFLPPDLTRDAGAKARFVQEARAAAALKHPGICTVYEIDEYDGRSFIAMELLEGQTLRARLTAGAMSVGEAVDIATQVAVSLEEAHNKGIVHRDVKPENIMLVTSGHVIIMDFGLARMPGVTRLTQTGSTIGTVNYMSPEQARGEEVDGRTDIWSLGAVLYEMLTGQSPFRGLHEQAVMFQIINTVPTPLAELRPDLAGPLDAIVRRALAKDPADRQQTAAELAADLRAAADHGAFGSSASVSEKECEGPSIAVLPFVNMSADPEQEYFCDGIAEEIINSLTKVKGLRVVARTSAFYFKGRTQDVREIGTRLGVETILEGSVRKSGSRVRITAQCVNVSNGYHIWSEHYDRQLEDVFAVQDEIAQSITEILKLSLVRPRVAPGDRRQVRDFEAYNLYLKGRYLWRGRTLQKIEKSLKMFEASIARDPSSGLGHSGVADVYNLLGWYGVLAPRDSFPKALEAAERALELDASLAEGWTSRGFAKLYYVWDVPGAEKDFQRAIALNPGYSLANHWYGEYYLVTGRLDQALEYGRRALECDPVNPALYSLLAWFLYVEREYDTSGIQCEMALELDPNLAWANAMLGFGLVKRDRCREAAAAFRKAGEQLGEGLFRAAEGYALAAGGDVAGARAILAELTPGGRFNYVSPCFVGAIHVALGDKESAFTYLEKALAERDLRLLFLSTDPIYDSLRSDSRYEELRARIALATGTIY